MLQKKLRKGCPNLEHTTLTFWVTLSCFRVDDWLNITRGNALGQRGHYWQNVFDQRDSYPVQPSQFYDLINTLCTSYTKTQLGGQFEFNRTLEVTLYKVNDSLDSLLVLALVKSLSTDLTSRFELKVELIEDSTPLSDTSRIKSMSVGTDFDPKELIFRNFLKVYGPRSEVGLRVEFTDGPKAGLNKTPLCFYLINFICQYFRLV